MRALVVYNNFSGKNKIASKIGYICQQLKTKYAIVECFKSRYPRSIVDHIKASAFDYDLIIAVGGDGTVNEAVNGLMQLPKRPTLAYIPLGTCNDAASTLGLSKNLKRTMKKILNPISSKIDVFKVEDRYFVYGLAAGSFTEISYDVPHKVKKNMGKLAYYIQGLKSFKDTSTINITLESEDKKIKGEFFLFLALNSRYLAGFKLHRRKRIYLDDGKLRLTLIKKTSKLFNVIDFGIFLLFGELYSHNIIHLASSKFKISSDELIAYNTDGERSTKSSNIEVEVLHRSLDVIISKRVLRRHFLNKN